MTTNEWYRYYAAPYAMQQYRYAGFLRRVFAYILDALIVMAGLVVGLLVLEAVTGIRLYSARGDADSFSVSFGGWPGAFAATIYFVWMNANGATVGKKALGIRVTSREGNPPGLRRSMLRSVIPVAGYTLPMLTGIATWIANQVGGWYPAFVTGGGAFGLIFMYSLFELGELLSMIWHEHKQTVHDQMGGTYVIRTP